MKLCCAIPEVHARERSNASIGLAHIAEIDSRKLYRQAGHPSIHSYCVNELLLSPQAAFKRIQAARAGRRFPAIFVAGRRAAPSERDRDTGRSL
jgi:hypothetical protein